MLPCAQEESLYGTVEILTWIIIFRIHSPGTLN